MAMLFALAVALVLTLAWPGDAPAQAQQSVHCQIEADGRCHCGPRRGTGRQIPCRPESSQQARPQAPVPAPAQTPAPAPALRGEIMLSRVERCSALWNRRFASLSRAPGIASRCEVPRGEDFTLEGRKYLPARTMQDMAALVFDNYNKAPILIAKINGTRSRYLLALSGTEMRDGQATGLIEDLGASVNQLNGYGLFVLSALSAYDNGRGVPHGSEIVLVGHSLGGMVAQTIASNTDRFVRWKMIRVVTLGSPKTAFLPEAVRVRHFAGKGDPVVSLSLIAAIGLFEQIWVDSGARGQPFMGGIENHLNYPRSTDLARFNAYGE
jgi:hypothetical protein